MANRAIITRCRGHGLLSKSYPLRHRSPDKILQRNWFSLSWAGSVFFWENKRHRKYLNYLVNKNRQIHLCIFLWILVVWVITTRVSMFYNTNSDDLCFVLIWLTPFQLEITAAANSVERFWLIIILAIFYEWDHYHEIFTRLFKLPNHW